MKHIGIWLISVACIVGLNTARADEGEKIFKSILKKPKSFPMPAAKP